MSGAIIGYFNPNRAHRSGVERKGSPEPAGLGPKRLPGLLFRSSRTALLLALAFTRGCRFITGSAKPKPALAAIPAIQAAGEQTGQSKKSSPLTMQELQAVNMSFADGVIMEAGAASEQLKQKLDSIDQRADIQQWKLSHATLMVILVSGQNPAVSLVDITACTTLARMIMEDYWVPEVFGPDARELLELHRKKEKEIWAIADQLPDRLPQAQMKVLEDLSKHSRELESLIKQFNAAFTSGEAMAQAVDQAVHSLESFTAQVTRTPGEDSSSRKPFGVLDYGTAAQSIAQAARDLNTAIMSLESLLSSAAWRERQIEFSLLVHEVESGGDQMLSRAAFLLGLLLAAFLIGLILSLLLYRYLAQKWFPHPAAAPPAT